MTSFYLWAQLVTDGQGWLTRKLLGVTLMSAEWVLWVLCVLSVISVAIMLERALYFASHQLPNSTDVLLKLEKGDLEGAHASLKNANGMEANVVREAYAARAQGSASVEEVIASTIAREKLRYERFMSFLGTLGSNAPFIGLFGTVLGIIKAFHDLGQSVAKGGAIQQTVMAGISEALVATAVGLAVAIPALTAYNWFIRQLKNTTARTNALGHALVGRLKAAGER
ncbi:MAG: MotA/TolQ/ExbB proton channel family protein [Myxococcaceae bacterium]|nr:MotA/TolQ/ExbB proton channel family protein [Myxococcaceae bacterium]